MFGIGAQEMIVIGLLFLVVFGPGKLPGMARDFGRFVGEARRHVDEFKSELTSTGNNDSNEPRRSDRTEVD
ncbi:MAG: twin-arginine translocase TatA/TatE family subunit [Rubrobacter sp.]|nr:twin-arginine translocase TatA/TatE family subunit [Rubrobacter sp.]MDQ3638026.1 twin-arginine translocase TatA/TatE family subunit [Actinomycetota bacterium]